MIELLSPVGDFECLKAAVQNGADAVYFGASLFSARAFASNFDDSLLEQAINYAKIRGVKTNLTLNTLIKNNELAEAINVAKKAYQFGIDAIIVQDLGLARFLIKNFPNLEVHASTQMSAHNLEGAKKLEELGFSRVVLSRELSLQEIDYICKNTTVEIEVFVHGALCISYSGQCLFSSMVGGRSGNRGKCAQPCRLPYELIENNSVIDKGYLLSPRDLCGLENLPDLVKSGVKCLKIEGRMKTPEYVATVTRIYRKYLDIINKNENFVIDPKDIQDLLQVFNRGNFSTGHYSTEPNKKLIYKEKSNNMGIFLGKITNFNNNKGHITFTTNAEINIGDKIAIENKKHETSLYTISELMLDNKNIKQAIKGQKIKIGRMKGNIFIGDKIYKISDKILTSTALDIINLETKKVALNCKILIKKDIPISLEVCDNNGISITVSINLIPEKAQKSPITKERIIAQLSKTGNTPFKFINFEIDLDEDLYIPSISALNELRRLTLSQYEEKLINSFKRNTSTIPNYKSVTPKQLHEQKQISLLLNLLNPDFDYSNLKNVKKVYIPFKYFIDKNYIETIKCITQHFNTYIYMPTIIRKNYTNLIINSLPNILKNFDIKGFVISNIGNFELLKNYHTKYEFICNYTFNIFNNLTIDELKVDAITLSPELNLSDISKINSSTNTELIVYGRTPLMNSNYCLLGISNKCYSSCKKMCLTQNKYYLKDRLGFLFRIVPDNTQTVTTIYNSKITSIEHKSVFVDFVRIDILDETISEINEIIDSVMKGEKLEGKDYTNGNFNKEI